MPAGTIALTNNSATVTGTGTSFTTELKVGDFIGVIVGSAPYTAIVGSIASNTSLALTVPFNGPTSSGLAWNAVPASLKIAITQQVLNDMGTVARGMILEKANWQKIFSSDQSVTVTMPDRTTFTGPSWGYMTTLINGKVDSSALADYLTKADNLGSLADKAAARTNLGLGDSATKNVGSAANTVMAGDAGLLKAGGTMSGAISFATAAIARQTLLNTGVNGNLTTIRIPISTTQYYQIIFGTANVTTDANGIGVVTFPNAFTTVSAVIPGHGGGGVGQQVVVGLDTTTTTAISFKCWNTTGSGSAYASAFFRLNYAVAGLVTA